jgi:hypothetical protein
MSVDVELEIGRIWASRSVELTAKGYSPDLVSDAILKSQNWALSQVKSLPEHIRDEAFLSFFRDDLKKAETWMDNWIESHPQQEANYRRGVEKFIGQRANRQVVTNHAEGLKSKTERR